MPGSSVPRPSFGPRGFTSPPESDVLTGVLADMNAAFGGRMNAALKEGQKTPQGQIATTTAALIGRENDLFAELTNQVDPDYADGRMQDAIARIYFIYRYPARSSTVDAVCSGQAGVVIPAGTAAKSSDGRIWLCTSGGTIGASSVTLAFHCSETGPVPCPTASLNAIYQSIPGWDTISNPAPGVPGVNIETRREFELRRRNSVAGNARGTVDSVKASVTSVADVLDSYVVDNPLGTSAVIGGITIAPRSLYAAVEGGTDLAVATAIFLKKPPGCGYTGNTTVTVSDANPDYTYPPPSYPVTFQRPAPLTIFFIVLIANSPLVPSNAQALVQNAILAAMDGEDGGPRARIGSAIYPSRFYAGIAALGDWTRIVSLTAGSINNSAVFTGSISGSVLTVTAVASGTIANGMFIAEAIPGARIASFGSGTGGTGTYNLNTSQTLASGTLRGVATGTAPLTVNIDQAPVTAAPYIVLGLV